MSADKALPAGPPEPTVFIVDDDDAVRDAVGLLLQCHGRRVRTYASGREFLDAYSCGEPGCLLLDLHMPGMSGVDIQRALRAQNCALPTVVITAYGEDPMTRQATAAGVVAVILKPFRDQELLERVEEALETLH